MSVDTTSSVARASMPRISAISCTNVFVSLASVLFDRNWEILARRHGCDEIFTLCGRSSMSS